MPNAFHYANTFDDTLAAHFKGILSLGFDPRQLDGLRLWLDGADSRAIVKNESGRVLQWLDKSSMDNHAYQNNNGNRPVYGLNPDMGKNTLLFSGSQLMFLPSSLFGIFAAGSTLFVVALQNTIGTQRLVAGTIAGSTRVNISIGSNGLQVNYYHNASFDIISSACVASQWNIYQATREGNTQNIAVNGSSGFSKNTAIDITGLTHLALGAHNSGDQGLRGEIVEVMIFNRALNPKEKLAVNEYLSAKWNIAIQS